MGVSFQIRNLERLQRELESIDAKGKKAIKATVKDIKKRAPSWVAQEVTNIYNIKKSEIVPSKGGRSAGSVKVEGEKITDITITYKGRLLTPVHFGMTPKAPPQGKKYKITMQVYKGKKKVIGRYLNTRTKGGDYSEQSHNILMPTGGSGEGAVPYIPFQRMSKDRNDVKKFVVTSVPQMVANPEISKAIVDRLNEESAKRLQHNVERFMNK